jgi:hypothetical protein
MPHLDINQWLTVAAIALGGFLGHRATSVKDHQRAELLAQIARGAAALAVSMNPNASWAKLVDNVVNQVATTAGVPTKSGAAIQRAAALALRDLGVKPTS